MKKYFTITGILVAFVLLIAIGLNAGTKHEFDTNAYIKAAKKAIGLVVSGNADPDKMLVHLNTLMEMGVAGCHEHMGEAETPDNEKKLMKWTIEQADKMPSLSLKEIEDQWHDGGFLKKKGIDIEKFEHFDEVMCHYDGVVHPATAIICINQYKKDKNEEHLDQIKDELAEVIEHMKHLE
jgi:hypothetical protein